MATGLDFTGMVPGIDFLQNLVKNAGAAMPNIPGLGAVPGMGQWVMPTLDPAELEKRISELRTVHFWLQQNAKLLEGTIQAMEVQRMTLSTLHSLNLPMGDLRAALSIKTPTAAAPPPPAAAARAFKFAPDLEPDVRPDARPGVQQDVQQGGQPDPEPEAAAQAAAPPVDPMKWWGALTQQFTEIAAQAMRASAAEAAATAEAVEARSPATPAENSTPAKRRAKRRARPAASTASAAKKKPAAKARPR